MGVTAFMMEKQWEKEYFWDKIAPWALQDSYLSIFVSVFCPCVELGCFKKCRCQKHKIPLGIKIFALNKVIYDAAMDKDKEVVYCTVHFVRSTFYVRSTIDVRTSKGRRI